MKKTLILSAEEITQKTRRIAYQVVEENYDEKEIVIVGIKSKGAQFAKALKREIEAIDDLKIVMLELSIDKSNPQGGEVSLNPENVNLNSKTVLLVDDVANTGKTMFYALQPILKFAPRKVQAAVLVDRQHKLFPITPDFVGLSLSTTLKEHILVEIDANKAEAFLI